MPHHIRLATEDDAQAIADIYAPIVRETAISFELVPPDAEVFRHKIREFLAFAPWLVCEHGGRIEGYAYASRFRPRPAYRFSVETTVYVHADARGGGVGRSLYEELFRRLERQRFRRAIAGITLPNPASVRLHESIGFEKVGTFHSVGFKLGRWHDVGFWEKSITPCVPEPPEPLQATEIL